MSSKGTDITIGRIKGVEKIEDLPKAILDSLLEGLSSSPQDFAILGMGFLVGYEGMDIMAFLMKPLQDLIQNIKDGIAGALTYPLDKLPVQMGGLIQDISRLAGGPIIFPNKHITPASKGLSGPGTSYYGPPPAGISPEDWPPYGTTLGKLEDEIAKASDLDKLKLELESALAEQKIKILMGCMGAITAYTLSRPGVVTGLAGAVGNVVSGALQAAGEAVPF